MEEYKKTEEKRKTEIREESSHGTVNPETKIEVKSAEDPHAADDSGIPGTNSNDNIGNAPSGAGLGGNKGRGTADFPNKNQ